MTIGYPLPGDEMPVRPSGWSESPSAGWVSPASIDGAPNPALEAVAILVGVVRSAVGTVDRVLASAQRRLLH